MQCFPTMLSPKIYIVAGKVKENLYFRNGPPMQLLPLTYILNSTEKTIILSQSI